MEADESSESVAFQVVIGMNQGELKGIKFGRKVERERILKLVVSVFWNVEYPEVVELLKQIKQGDDDEKRTV